MKIGIYLGNFQPSSGGGFTFLHRIVRALAQCAPETSHQFVVLGPKGDIEAPANMTFAEMHSNQWRRVRLALGRRGILPRASIYRNGVKYEVTSAEAEIVLAHNFDLLWCPIPVTPTFEIPFIMTVWDLQHRVSPYFPEVSAAGNWKNREETYAEALRRASGIVTGVEQGKREIREFYQVPSERVFVNPLPAPDPAEFNNPTPLANLAKQYGITKDYLFYPAQFWPHKNHVRILESLPILRKKWDLDFEVVFSGAPKSNLDHVTSIARELDVADRVKFVGFISDGDLAGLYKHAAALVFPSYFGPDNLPPLEACALGCPAIVADVPGVREQLGDAAVFFDPRSSDGLAEAVASLSRSPQLRERLRTNGLNLVCKRTPDDYVRRMFAVFDSLAPIRRCWGA